MAAAALLHWLPLGSVITLRVDNQLNLPAPGAKFHMEIQDPVGGGR